MSVLDQIRELDPNDPGRWPLTFRLGAIGLIFVVGVVLLAYFLAWKPKKPELDAARAEETRLLATLEQTPLDLLRSDASSDVGDLRESPALKLTVENAC